VLKAQACRGASVGPYWPTVLLVAKLCGGPPAPAMNNFGDGIMGVQGFLYPTTTMSARALSTIAFS
jgi:hypothetical protein